ncbi:MAG: sigma-70 family RNA polymerase sigma factor [Acidobacteria bacterium]|jgi:RNA polymerase sigma-70 factor (ECF subfamily)|nr:sigma-70 family RNA polymerase sigma factor [Acidobacteriota bacterium]
MDEAGHAGVPSDGDLARVVSGGGSDATEAEAELFRRLAPRVRLYGLRHLRDPAAADDLVQEVFVLTLEQLRAGRVREPDRLASFVFGTCRLVVRNLRRGQKRREDLLDRFAGVFPRRAETDLLLLDQNRLRACLEGLGPRERTVLVLTFFAEQPSSEIGARLSLSSENVRTIRRRAFVSLRDCVLGTAA